MRLRIKEYVRCGHAQKGKVPCEAATSTEDKGNNSTHILTPEGGFVNDRSTMAVAAGGE